MIQPLSAAGDMSPYFLSRSVQFIILQTRQVRHLVSFSSFRMVTFLFQILLILLVSLQIIYNFWLSQWFFYGLNASLALSLLANECSFHIAYLYVLNSHTLNKLYFTGRQKQCTHSQSSHFVSTRSSNTSPAGQTPILTVLRALWFIINTDLSTKILKN